MIELGKTFARLLDAEGRRSFVIFTVISFFAGVIEVVGIGSVMPFIGVLLQPAIIAQNPVLSGVYGHFGFTSTNDFIVCMGMATIGLITAGGLINIFSVRYQLNVTYMIGHKWAVSLLTAYLAQPYEFFLRGNTNKIKATVLSDVDRVVASVLMPFGVIISRSLVIVFLVVLLLVVNPVVTGLLVAVTGGIYGALLLYFRQKMKAKGEQALQHNSVRFKSANEALSCIRDIKLHDNAEFFIDNFRQASRSFAVLQSYSLFHGQIPRFMIEIIGFVSLILLLLYLLVAGKGDVGAIIPLIALFAASGYKILPAAQNLYSSLNSIRFNSAALEAVAAGMALTVPTSSAATPGKPVSFTREISIRDLGFAYEASSVPVLQDVNAVLAKNTMIGVVGPTGAGKSTFIDILIGLLPPGTGEVRVDGEALGPDMRRWQEKIAYVPQHVEILDGTVAENIAFGQRPDRIDRERIMSAARAAQIESFISQSPQGMDASVGEDGSRLSGGQRQRIGIARALYFDREIVVMDEPTSALDKETAESVVRNLRDISRQRTVVIITHNLDVLNYCDQVLFIKDGRLQSAPDVKTMAARNAEIMAFVGDGHGD
jgi:ABC-type bacteriocin/lantibiotic exporter with double-glycine peptidase domain